VKTKDFVPVRNGAAHFTEYLSTSFLEHLTWKGAIRNARVDVVGVIPTYLRTTALLQLFVLGRPSDVLLPSVGH
jgi:hypothetical protein